MIVIEKLLMQKYINYCTDLNIIGGQITRNGTLLLIESALQELDFFERPIPKNNWTIRVIKKDNIETINLKNVPLIPTELDLFSDGTLLIVQGRCLKEGKKIERNARRYNVNGQLIEAFTLGDGISNVQIDEQDTIWVSYFDEGIFGNFGWEQPIGCKGLVAFSKNGQKLWEAADFSIIDCYAMNVVSSKEVYFYYYDDFNLIELSNMKETVRYLVQGENTIHQFVFDSLGLIGQVDLDTVMRFRVYDRTIKPKGKLVLVDENNKRINGQIFMRGSFLYAFGKDAIYNSKL